MNKHDKPVSNMTFKEQTIAIYKALIPFKTQKATALSVREVIKTIDLEAGLRHYQGLKEVDLKMVEAAAEMTTDERIEAMLGDIKTNIDKPELQQPRPKKKKQKFHVVNADGDRCFDLRIREERTNKIYCADQGTTFPAGHRDICEGCGQTVEIGEDIVMRQPD